MGVLYQPDALRMPVVGGDAPQPPPSVRWFDLESEKLVIISVSDTYRAELEDR